MSNKISQLKTEWDKFFEEKEDKVLKSTVFRILGAKADIEKQKAALALQVKMLDERNKELDKELTTLEK